MNSKSDRKAKEEFCKKLIAGGFDSAEIKVAPADIMAIKNGEIWWFEIKQTTQEKNYFGAATETEWEQAFNDPDHFRFVIAQTNKSQTKFGFTEYTPDEFIQFCTIPPFKVFFNINLEENIVNKKHYNSEKKSIAFSQESFRKIHDVFTKLRGEDEKQVFNNSKAEKIKVTYPNGDVIFERFNKNTLIEVIKRAGIERVKNLGIVAIKKNNLMLISKEEYHDKSGKTQEALGKYFIHTKVGTGDIVTYINQISDGLKLNLVIKVIQPKTWG